MYFFPAGCSPSLRIFKSVPALKYSTLPPPNSITALSSAYSKRQHGVALVKVTVCQYLRATPNFATTGEPPNNYRPHQGLNGIPNSSPEQVSSTRTINKKTLLFRLHNHYSLVSESRRLNNFPLERCSHKSKVKQTINLRLAAGSFIIGKLLSNLA